MVPEVIYDPGLFLSPHVYPLAMLFKRPAFRVDELNDDPSALSRLTVCIAFRLAQPHAGLPSQPLAHSHTY